MDGKGTDGRNRWLMADMLRGTVDSSHHLLGFNAIYLRDCRLDWVVPFCTGILWGGRPQIDVPKDFHSLISLEKTLPD